MDDKRTDRAKQEKQLDDALKATFPASDPVAIQSASENPIGGNRNAKLRLKRRNAPTRVPRQS